ncbi:DNA-binding CsgD family transcriptional regulator [Mycoplana sp. BE70]|uniref:helix-turn-helix transcriptional regulator n=1 Tax=Mycoplana sp. BE70 TaxID=2817775 RepID=UPI00285D0CC7|nr:LuxR C-terminal-related transcriptional regulator [Mycoplana sp. BE70]MDR6754943.1 DNA-binding CsgD family transcriptional regulator [Mycoplana sp. BE70]
MAQGAGAHGTALFNTSATSMRVISSASLDDLSQKMLEEGWINRNTRAAKLLTIDHHGFIDEADYFTEDDYNTQPIFTEVMKPLGYGFGTSTFITSPSGDRMIFAVEKKKRTGPVTPAAIGYLDQLRPHLARAAMMSSRLEFERIKAAVEALQLSGLPSAVLNREGRVLGTNQLLQEMAPQIAIGGYDSLYFHHAAANRLLAEGLAQRRVHGSLASRSFPLPQVEQHPPAVVHIVAVEGNARDIFTNAAALLVVTPIDRTRVPTAETIQGLYDLTPAEAKIARALAAGNNVVSAALQMSVSPETVRTHVKAILSKSGMSRQADFIAAIASIRSI